ncbi:hypothetical protein GV828_10615 [Flavobacterium sp. NST-5]|uniref:TonB C-terminal domain-containing protein n=1 Tax=Flavobacterium ichthyis TaxID=2698827 RepID=A0ABW9ZFV0_9FLAO|nr:energy transducer TonB [Flavobacterium ichthyis]NBL65653.1 hypothetical protein [Flavobacterium ichthyis]
MKKIVFSLLLILAISLSGFAQENVNSETPLENKVVVTEAGFDGGDWSKFATYLMKNYRMPDDNRLKGTLLITFVVNADNSISDMKVISDPGYGSVKNAFEALKRVKNKFTAAKDANGNPVATVREMKMQFNISNLVQKIK